MVNHTGSFIHLPRPQDTVLANDTGSFTSCVGFAFRVTEYVTLVIEFANDTGPFNLRIDFVSLAIEFVSATGSFDLCFDFVFPAVVFVSDTGFAH